MNFFYTRENSYRGLIWWHRERCLSQKIKMVWVLFCLGIIDLRVMNKALTGNGYGWFKEPDSLWRWLIHQKFYTSRNIMELNRKKGHFSPFWKGVLVNLDRFFLSTFVTVENEYIFFWHDFWIGSKFLVSLYHELFNRVVNPRASVASMKCRDNNGWRWKIQFKR